ncbi:MAG: nitrogen regulation protein NR(II) [Haloferacaceae archaeon]
MNDPVDPEDGTQREEPLDDPEPRTAGDYERLVDSLSTHAIFELDASGAITTWSTPGRTLYGRDAAAVRGEPVAVLFAADAEPTRPLSEVLDTARTETATMECWHQRDDGSVFWGTLTVESLWDDEILKGFTVVSQDTTDRKQYERMLERQNDRLKEFTDILAHDLRSPLNVIDGRLTLYEETGDHEHIAVVENTTDQMERLVDDLLRVARQGDVVTDPVPVDLEAVVALAWGNTLAEQEATLACESVGEVSADGDRLREMFENLFRNAAEHGGPGVAVTVGRMETGFYVADDGPGIPDGMREEVFDHGVSTSDEGSGYGLSIVRTIANAHGWDVVVTTADTGGARFEFTGVEPID